MISERARIIREYDKKSNALCAKKVREARIAALQEVLDTIAEFRERGWEKGNILDAIIGRLFGEIQRGGD